MKHLISTSTIIAVIILTVSGWAQEIPVIDPFSVDAPASTPPSNPNHLEPIPAYDPDGYDQAVFRSLVGMADADAWMIGKPSFSPEYAVILRHSNKTDDPFDRRMQSQRWVLEFVEAKKRIWRWKDLDGGRMELDIEVTKDLNTKSVEIAPEFAAAILEAWDSVLRKTRYPDTDYRGLDGATYQFYSRYGLFGEIWTPYTGIPRMITELGHELCAVAKANEKDRVNHIEKCLGLADEIRNAETKPEQDATGQPATRSESK